MDALTAAAWKVIQDFTQRGPSREQLSGSLNAVERELETGYIENGPLLKDMMTKVENGEDLAELFNMRPFYDRLTPTGLRDAARQYLNMRRYVQVTLRPEQK